MADVTNSPSEPKIVGSFDPVPLPDWAQEEPPHGDLRMRVEHDFTRHAPDRRTETAMAAMRESVKVVARGIVDNSGDCREVHLALTRLEEALYWWEAALLRYGLRK